MNPVNWEGTPPLVWGSLCPQGSYPPPSAPSPCHATSQGHHRVSGSYYFMLDTGDKTLHHDKWQSVLCAAKLCKSAQNPTWPNYRQTPAPPSLRPGQAAQSWDTSGRQQSDPARTSKHPLLRDQSKTPQHVHSRTQQPCKMPGRLCLHTSTQLAAGANGKTKEGNHEHLPLS